MTSGQVVIRHPLKHFNLCTLKEDCLGFVDLEVLRMIDAKTVTPQEKCSGCSLLL